MDHFVVITQLVNGTSHEAVLVGANEARAFFDFEVTATIYGHISSVYLYKGYVDIHGVVRHFPDPIDCYEG